MVKLKVELWKTLQELNCNDFKDFKWLLNQDNIMEDFPGIPKAQLEKADRHETVDLMVQTYEEYRVLRVTMKILKEMNMNDLVQRLRNSCSGLEGAQKEENTRKKPKLKSAQKFAVEVTLDPDTAHPNLILSDEGKQVHHGDERKKLPDNPERFYSCVNVLGKESFSSGRFYYEVQVTEKTAWTVGVAEESIKRNGQITLSPENGFWTIWLSDRDKYMAIDENPVSLSVKKPPQKVGVFVDYEEGLICFYDVDAADLLYAFTKCSFTEGLYPFFSPCTNDKGRNSAPLIISPVNPPPNLKTHESSEEKKQYERKKADLKGVQKFAVDVILDPDTAHPNLILSDEGKQVHHGDERKKLPDNPERFYSCVDVLGKQSFSSGRFYYEVQVTEKTAWTVGVAKESIKRNRQIILSPENGFWTIWLRNRDKYMANDENPVRLSVKKPPQKVGVFVDYEEGLICFYDVDAADLLYAFTKCSFTEGLYPFFSPCTNDKGRNSAPLIISPVNPPPNLKTHESSEEKKQYERKKADLKSAQKFAVDVILDPDTAHPNLILSDEGKQVHHGDERKKLPDNPERFYSCVNVLGKESFSSGRFYYEVQVTEKTAWTVGVAEESIKRNGQITLSPENGFWTIWLRDRDEYMANDENPVSLSVKKPPQKVGVFVDYEEGIICFYDVDAADLLYAFTKCSFTEGLYPFFSPCTNDKGRNSAPLIISPVNHTD
ncbi:hypothetical protein PAMP_015276 [Pampus punctatissimus]